jgi:hypothetical protein
MAKTRVTIDSDLKVEHGTSKNGKPYTERYQEAYLHVAGAKYPKACKLSLYENGRPFPVGDYETEQEVYINDYNKLRVKSEIALAPVAAAKS